MESPRNFRASSKLHRRLLLAAEVLLVLVIVGLIVAMWLPGLIGPHPTAR
jgi:hypothetical protein